MPHPFRAGQRLYRTGDLGRWRRDGNIDFVGRVDNQVKIRGYRVELAEIETQLQSIAGVRQAVVVARQGVGRVTDLAAYFTAEPGIDEIAIRAALRDVLPEYMVPARFVRLDRFPLTANGKVDRAALPDPGQSSSRVAPCLEPAGETERAVLDVWQDVLERPDIGVTDNFFELGGHSLQAVKVMTGISRRLGVEVPFTALFNHPTVRGLAAAVLDQVRFGAEIADASMVLLGTPGRPALFAFPPGLGDAAGYIQLAKALGDYSFYAFNFVDSLSMVRDYARQIEEAQPSGPYVLIGYSSGGNLAFHVARQLERAGRRVSALVMIDAAVRLNRMPYPPDIVEQLTRQFLDDDHVRPFVSTAVLRDKAARRIAASLAWAGNTLDLEQVTADIHVIGCAAGPDDVHDYSGALVSSKPAWARATSGRFKRYSGHGEHRKMLAGPHLEQNAGMLRGILSEILPPVREAK